jgi:hypothetical protein
VLESKVQQWDFRAQSCCTRTGRGQHGRREEFG